MALPISSEFTPNRRLTVDLELANVCNFRCPICPHAYRDKPEQTLGQPFSRKPTLMSVPLFERAVEECNRVASRVELGFFGEQTLHPRYFEFLDRLKQRNFALETNTNLSRVTHETMQAWISTQMDLLRLSVDAITPEVFNRARPGDVQDLNGKTVDEADRMEATNEKLHAWFDMPDHRPTRLVFVRSSHNVGEEEKFIDYWRPYLGPQDYILIKQVLTYGGIVPDPTIEPHRCNVWEMRYLMIAANGDLTPCNLDVNVELHLGNIMQDSIESLYTGPIAQWMRTQTGCGKNLSPCNTCVDSNNWSKNRTVRGGVHTANNEGLRPPQGPRP